MAASAAPDQATAAPPNSPPATPAAVANAALLKRIIEDIAPLRAVMKVVEAHPWLIALFFTSVITVKILAAAKGDTATAGMLLGTGGVSDLTSIILLTCLPTAASAAFVITTGLTLGIAGAQKGSQWVVPAVVAFLIAIFAAVIVPREAFLLVAVIAALLGVPLFVLNFISRRKAEKNGVTVTATFGGGGRREFAIVLSFALPLTLIAAAWSPTLWLPAERIMVNMEPQVGYILSTDGDYTHILLEKDRNTLTVPSDQVTERRRCDLPLSGASLIPALGKPPSYKLECVVPEAK